MEQGSHVAMKFLRFNFIDIYNFHINSVDMADQLVSITDLEKGCGGGLSSSGI